MAPTRVAESWKYVRGPPLSVRWRRGAASGPLWAANRPETGKDCSRPRCLHTLTRIANQPSLPDGANQRAA